MDGGYSKIGIIHSQNSRSMDVSDPGSKTQLETNLQIKNKHDKQAGDEIQHQDRSLDNGKGSHTVLKRNRSVSSSSASSSSSSSSSGFQSAVKGAISSMRRSSSTVSERYSRIHDQSVTCIMELHEGEQGLTSTTAARSNNKSHNRRKILKACKRLFGLH